jgi:hypothetical protein
MYHKAKTFARDFRRLCKDDIVDILITDSEEEKIEIHIIIRNNNIKQLDIVSKEIKKASKSKVKIDSLNIEDILNNNTYLSLVHRAYSVKRGQSLSKTLSAESLYLITYELTNLNHSQKTMFGYALKGRTGEKGILSELKGRPVGRNNILIPSSQIDQLKDFFATWQVKYNIQQFLRTQNE